MTPNPFAEFDTQQKYIERLEERIVALEQLSSMLIESVGLVMRAENFRLDRKMKNERMG